MDIGDAVSWIIYLIFFFNDYHLFLLIQKRSSIDSFIFFFDPDFFVHLFTYELSSLPTS